MSESPGVRNEMALLGSALLAGERVLPILMEARCRDAWFQDGRCRAVWRALDAMWREGQAEGVDAVTVAERLRVLRAEEKEAGPQVEGKFLEEILEGCPTAAHVEHYAQIVRGQYLSRKGKKLAQKFGDAVDTGPELAVREFQRGIVDLLDEASGGGAKSVGEALDRAAGEFNEAHQIRMVEGRMDYCPGLPMPWKCMTALYNGLQPGLHIVGARPSTGKTALMVNWVRWWCEQCGLPVAFNSLDMETGQLVKRFVAEVARVSLPKMSFGTTGQSDLARMGQAYAQINKWPLHLAVKRDLEEFRSWCIMMKVKHDVKVIIVDFLQLLTFRECYRMGVDDRVSHISGTLKAIGNDLGVPIIALSQLNRECEREGGREPEISDLRGSGALEQDAFTVLMLHRDPEVWRKWQDDEPPLQLTPFGATGEKQKYLAQQLRPVWGMLKKNQNGRTGNLPLVLFPGYFLFMLGDYQAYPIRPDPARGKKNGPDNSPKFRRVLGDWRAESMEEALAQSGGLVTGYRDGE